MVVLSSTVLGGVARFCPLYTGKPSLSTRTNVTVTVVDRAMPSFDEVLYTARVSESLPQYATVLTVSAKSPTSAGLVYSIIDGNALGQFGVDFSVGKLVFIFLCFYISTSLVC